MLPKLGCADILPARSRVSDVDPSSEEDVPGAGRVDGCEERASMGRRGARRDIERHCEGGAILQED
tara:strand:+ start:2220 stop:2417 length:198 start_codon:yes stop_codon:yes gene_type:complete